MATNNYEKKIIAYVDTHSSSIRYGKETYIEKQINKDGISFLNNYDSYRGFNKIPYPKQMTLREIGFFSVLIKFLDSDNFLGVYEKRIYRPMTIKDICKIFDFNERQTKEYLKKLYNCKMICYVNVNSDSVNKEEWIALNPIYCCFGKRITLTTYKLFRNMIDSYLPKRIVETLNKILSSGKELNEYLEDEYEKIEHKKELLGDDFYD